MLRKYTTHIQIHIVYKNEFIPVSGYYKVFEIIGKFRYILIR